jgi:(p)ppGpp synthase/HD superfamily hydrolase
MPGVSEREIACIDGDGPAVYQLVMEVTIRHHGSHRESKAEYLTRIMERGSSRAQVLKLADRISNLTALGFVHEGTFVRRFVKETRTYILPHAERINANMYRELTHLIESRERLLPVIWTADEPLT